MTKEKAIELAFPLNWKSIDKDNMEFTLTTTCWGKEAIEFLINEARRCSCDG